MALKEVAWPLPAAWEVKFWYFWRSCRSSTNICTAANSYPSQTVRWVQLFWQQNATLEPDGRRILDPSWILSLQITLEHLITRLLTAGPQFFSKTPRTEAQATCNGSIPPPSSPPPLLAHGASGRFPQNDVRRNWPRRDPVPRVDGSPTHTSGQLDGQVVNPKAFEFSVQGPEKK